MIVLVPVQTRVMVESIIHYRDRLNEAQQSIKENLNSTQGTSVTIDQKRILMVREILD